MISDWDHALGPRVRRVGSTGGSNSAMVLSRKVTVGRVSVDER